MHELVYTSAPRGVRPGHSGFGPVRMTAGLPQAVSDALERLSGYEHLADPGSAENPVAWSYLKLPVAGRKLAVLSRVSDAGRDHTNRSNNLAQHFVLGGTRPPGGPAAVFQTPGLFLTKWTGEPEIVEKGNGFPAVTATAGPCRQTEALTGDAGWAGRLAETVLKGERVVLSVRPGQDVLPMLAEAIALLPPKKRWNATFTTYFQGLPPGTDCLWQCVVAGTDQEAAALKSAPLHLDLTRAGAAGRASGTAAEKARAGQPIEEARELIDPRKRTAAATATSLDMIDAPARPNTPPPPPDSRPTRSARTTRRESGGSSLTKILTGLMLLGLVACAVLIVPLAGRLGRRAGGSEAQPGAVVVGETGDAADPDDGEMPTIVLNDSKRVGQDDPAADLETSRDVAAGDQTAASDPAEENERPGNGQQSGGGEPPAGEPPAGEPPAMADGDAAAAAEAPPEADAPPEPPVEQEVTLPELAPPLPETAASDIVLQPIEFENAVAVASGTIDVPQYRFAVVDAKAEAEAGDGRDTLISADRFHSDQAPAGLGIKRRVLYNGSEDWFAVVVSTDGVTLEQPGTTQAAEAAAAWQYLVPDGDSLPHLATTPPRLVSAVDRDADQTLTDRTVFPLPLPGPIEGDRELVHGVGRLTDGWLRLGDRTTFAFADGHSAELDGFLNESFARFDPKGTPAEFGVSLLSTLGAASEDGTPRPVGYELNWSELLARFARARGGVEDDLKDRAAPSGGLAVRYPVGKEKQETLPDDLHRRLFAGAVSVSEREGIQLKTNHGMIKAVIDEAIKRVKGRPPKNRRGQIRQAIDTQLAVFRQEIAPRQRGFRQLRLLLDALGNEARIVRGRLFVPATIVDGNNPGDQIEIDLVRIGDWPGRPQIAGEPAAVP